MIGWLNTGNNLKAWTILSNIFEPLTNSDRSLTRAYKLEVSKSSCKSQQQTDLKPASKNLFNTCDNVAVTIAVLLPMQQF